MTGIYLVVGSEGRERSGIERGCNGWVFGGAMLLRVADATSPVIETKGSFRIALIQKINKSC